MADTADLDALTPRPRPLRRRRGIFAVLLTLVLAAGLALAASGAILAWGQQEEALAWLALVAVVEEKTGPSIPRSCPFRRKKWRETASLRVSISTSMGRTTRRSREQCLHAIASSLMVSAQNGHSIV